MDDKKDDWVKGDWINFERENGMEGIIKAIWEV